MTCRRLLPRPLAEGLARIIARFGFDRRGNVAAIFALLLVPLIGVLSLAAETSSWYLMGRAAQNAADSAALAAAANFDTSQGVGTCATHVNWCAEAKSVAANAGFTDGSAHTTVAVSNNATCPSGGTTNCYQVTVTKQVPLYLVGVMGYTGTGHSGMQTITASAMAGPGQGGQVCILTLDKRSGDIHSIFGGTNANATVGGSCTVANNDPTGNGQDFDSTDVKSGATLNFAHLSLADAGPCDPPCGGTLIVNGTTITNGTQKPSGAQYDQPAVIDPYAGRTVPAATGACDHFNMTVTATTTLSQGTYCGTNGNAALSISSTSLNLNDKAPAPPPTGTKVLNFMTTSGVSNGMIVSDTTHTSAIPAGTTVTAFTATTVTLSVTVDGGPQGVNANDVINFTGGPVTATLSPGVYILDGQGGGTGASACTGASKPTGCLSGNLVINGATVTGAGVTIVLTTSKGVGIDVGNVNITNGGSLSITAPTSNVGSYQVAGIALWQNPIAPNPTATDGNMYTSTTAGVNTVSSGASTDVTGLIYFPSQGLFYSGGSGGSVCTQIVAFSIVFVNRSTFSYPSDCPSAAGEQSIGSNVKSASLVQ